MENLFLCIYFYIHTKGKPIGAINRNCVALTPVPQEITIKITGWPNIKATVYKLPKAIWAAHKNVYKKYGR